MITSYDQLPPFAELFEPDFRSGKLYWKVSRHPKIKIGAEAGYLGKTRGINNKSVSYYGKVHLGDAEYWRCKILYYLRYGLWVPTIDHINGITTDDSITNLRESSRSRNNQNIHTKINCNIDYRPQNTKRPFMAYQANPLTKRRWFSFQATKEEAQSALKTFSQELYGDDLTVDYYTNIEQGSEIWHFLRQNRLTATKAYQLLKGKPIDEIIKASNSASFTGNYWTQRGKDLEPEAREIYTRVYNPNVHEVGGIINSKHPLAWYSPDGCVGLDGLIEIKCFSEKHHLAVMKKVDSQIIAQMQFGLWLSEREWIDFIAYNPDIEDIDKTFFVKRFYPDLEMHQKFETFFKTQLAS